MNLMSIKCKVCPLCPVNKDSSMTSFQVRCFKDKRFTGMSVFKYFRTILTSHELEYLGNGGLLLNTPRINLVTSGCSPIVLLMLSIAVREDRQIEQCLMNYIPILFDRDNLNNPLVMREMA